MSEMLLIKLPPDRLEKSFGPGLYPGAILRFDPYQPVTQDEFKNAMDLLAQIEAADADEKARRNAATFKRKWPLLYEELESCAEVQDTVVEDLIGGEGEEELDQVLDSITDDLNKVIWMWENREKIHKAVHQVRDARLMEFIRSAGGVTQRALDDIGRAFYRTLSELRRQQDWRLLRNALTVEDVIHKTD